VRARLGEGRFGTVYVADDPATAQSVVVRTFTRAMGADEQARLVDALGRLCETPLDHRSIARPLTAGLEHGAPYLVHTQLAGVPLDAFLRTHGPQPLQDVVMCLTQVAAAIDFAAAAGVHHGALTAADVILAPEGAGITGFGLVQALNAAGLTVEGATPAWAADITALAAMAYELLTGRTPDADAELPPMEHVDAALLRQAFDAGLSRDAAVQPKSALEFAAALQHTILDASGSPSLPRGVRLQPDLGDAGEDDAPATVVRTQPPLWDFSHTDEPTFRDVHPAPAADFEATLHERHDPAPAVVEVEPAVATAAPALFAASAPPPRESRTGWLLVAGALMIGLLGGFAGGFFTGQRGAALPLPPAAARAGQDDAAGARAGSEGGAARESDAPQGAVPPFGGVPETGSAGREIPAGDLPQVVAPPEVKPEPGPPAPARPAADAQRAAADAAGGAAADAAPPAARVPAPAPVPPAAQLPPRATPADGPGSMQVLSRPDGAQVYVDGAFVGRTPFVLASVTPGPHEVRIELDGHQRWATTVQVAAGERTRVAASLEQ
jgi:hypothetical protein